MLYDFKSILLRSWLFFVGLISVFSHKTLGFRFVMENTTEIKNYHLDEK